MSDNCFLCNCSINEGHMKTKRKRLSGSSAKKAVEILNELAAAKYRSRIAFDQHGYICHKCQKRTEGLIDLQIKVDCEKEAILTMVNNHFTSRKRNREQPDEPVVSSSFSTPTSSTSKVCSGSTDEIPVSVKVDYPSGGKTIDVTSPWGRKNVKRIARRHYASLSSSIVSSPRTSDHVISNVCHTILKEVKNICSVSHDSILRDTHEGIKHFSWQTVYLELKKNVPTLIKFLTALLPQHKNSRSIICLIASMILKKRLGKMSLVQRAISILLYGNGCSKQVFKTLQSVMVCHSHSGTLKLVDRISEDYDVQVKCWANELKENLKERSAQSPCVFKPHLNQQDEDEQDEEQIVYEEPDEEDIVSDDEDVCTNDEGEHDEILDDIDTDQFLKIITDIVNSNNDNEDDKVPSTEDKTSRDKILENLWKGFKIVGDNLDKNFRRTFQRIDYQTLSYHFFHSYAVLDRIDLSGLSDLPPSGVVDFLKVLPTKEDVKELKKNLSILVARILFKHFPQFKADKPSVVWHIPHEQSENMSKKSETVPLGILLHNENKLDEMCKIMDALHQYVPTESKEVTNSLPNDETITHGDFDVWETLFGGDQLTAARIRGASSIRANHPDAHQRLEGLIPTVEDWHARMTFMKVIWIRLFNNKSGMDKGTLFQLKNLLNRSSVQNDPQDNMNSAEDFLNVVLEGYIVAAAKIILKPGTWKGTLNQLSDEVIEKYVCLLPEKTSSSKDKVFTYTREVITLGLLWSNYLDATREGDGERVMGMWKFLLLVFRKSGRRNYAKEAALLLLQYHCFFSERKAAQLKHSRFVNTKGRIGCNMPCDLFMEHLNRRLKGVISHMGSNIQPPSLVRAAKAIGIVDNVCNVIEQEISGSHHEADQHSEPSSSKDFKMIVDELVEANVCVQSSSKRNHASVKITDCLLNSIDTEDITSWLVENVVASIIY